MDVIGISLNVFSWNYWLLKFYFQFIAHFFSISKLFFFGLLCFLTDFFLCVIYHYPF